MLKNLKKVRTGLDLFFKEHLRKFKGSNVGLVVNQASINSNYKHAVDLFSENKTIRLKALFGPQHGIYGNTQDNMITWKGFAHPRLNIPIFSLYGKTRVPTEEMLSKVDVIILDLQDVGTRIYTFIYTMANVISACKRFNKKIIVLDRPNPINGIQVEGNVLEPEYSSFVGLFPIATRHGMTIGELAKLFNEEFKINAELEVIPMKGWKREMWFDDTGLPWVLPSPNMPSLETAMVFSGTVHLEGTNISEGRGTTRPFEIIGAPFIDPLKLLEVLWRENLKGVFFRSHYFQPTFNKWEGKLCGGLQIHVLNRNIFKPVITGIAIIKAIYNIYSELFRWGSPPYEYVYDKLPFDVIAGTDKLRIQIMDNLPAMEIENSWNKDLSTFSKIRKKYLIY